MSDRIDPELLLFLQKLPPEVRELLLQDIVNNKSRLVDESMGNRPAIFTPGENGSYVIPRTGPMKEPTFLPNLGNKRAKTIPMEEPILLQALDNKRRKRAKAIMDEERLKDFY